MLVGNNLMYKLRAREYSGKNEESFGFLHTMPLAQYFDSFNLGFSDLAAFNDSRFSQNDLNLLCSSNIEIITFVIDGEMTFKGLFDEDILLKSGDIQLISCSSEIVKNQCKWFSEKSAHFIQIAILPCKKNVESACQKKNFSEKLFQDKLKLVASSSGREGSLKIKQDINIYKSIINMDKISRYPMKKNRKFWIQVINGAIDVNSNILESGDAISIVGEESLLEIVGVESSSAFLLLDLRNLFV